MAMIPLGSDGEPGLDLMPHRGLDQYAPGDYLKSRWDQPYHE